MDYTQLLSDITEKIASIKDIAFSAGRRLFAMLSEAGSAISESGKKWARKASDATDDFKAKTKALKDTVINFLYAAGIALAFFTALVLFFYTLFMSFGNTTRKKNRRK